MYTQVIRILKQRGFVEASALLEALTSWRFGKQTERFHGEDDPGMGVLATNLCGLNRP